MTPTDDRVTVVTTVWNAARFVEQAIASVLEQTVLPGGIVVVDDGSTDDGAERARAMSPLVTVVARSHEGVGPARTAGVEAVSSELVALIDADDLWLPQKLERQLAMLDEDPSIDAVFTLVDEFEDFTGARPPGLRAPQAAVATPITSAALFRRSLFATVGPFGNGPVGDWIEWWSAARRAGIVERFVPEVLVRRRLHGGNNSLRANDDGATLLRIARAHLHAARRAEPT